MISRRVFGKLMAGLVPAVFVGAKVVEVDPPAKLFLYHRSAVAEGPICATEVLERRAEAEMRLGEITSSFRQTYIDEVAKAFAKRQDRVFLQALEGQRGG